jgi:hypothetical protein
MTSFRAELRVAGSSFPLTHCSFGVQQGTHQRGRASTKMRYEPVQLTLDVPEESILLSWAAAPQKRLAAVIVFLSPDGGSAIETLRLPGAYCTSYQEVFQAGNALDGAYQCQLVLSDPEGFTLQAGGPATEYIAPAIVAQEPPPATNVAASQRPSGGRGPTGFGDTRGEYSGRLYDAENCGGPIQKLDWRTARIGAAGIATVKKHVARFIPPTRANQKMITRLEQIAAGAMSSTDFDKRYYTHELREYERYRALGVPDGNDPGYEVWNDAHSATLEDYQLNERVQPLYHPDITEEDFE